MSHLDKKYRLRLYEGEGNLWQSCPCCYARVELYARAPDLEEDLDVVQQRLIAAPYPSAGELVEGEINERVSSPLESVQRLGLWAVQHGGGLQEEILASLHHLRGLLLRAAEREARHAAHPLRRWR